MTLKKESFCNCDSDIVPTSDKLTINFYFHPASCENLFKRFNITFNAPIDVNEIT